jgi:hypothetical protein
MADLTSLSPEQMLLLQQLGMMRGLGDMGASTVSNNGPISATASNFAISPDTAMQLGNVSGALPFDGGSIRGGVNYQGMNFPGSNQTTVVPNVGVNLGPMNANYSAAFTPQGTQQSVGGGFDFGPFALNYQRGLGNERVKPTDTFGVSAPIGPALLNAAMTRGEGIPTQYTGGVTVPGLLGGDLGVTASYSPEDKKRSVFGRFSKRF